MGISEFYIPIMVSIPIAIAFYLWIKNDWGTKKKLEELEEKIRNSKKKTNI